MAKPMYPNVPDPDDDNEAPLYGVWGDSREEYSRKMGEQERARYLNDLKVVSNTPHGLRVLRDMLLMCQVGEDLMTGGASTYYLLGLRFVGIHIRKDLEQANPDAAVKIYKMMIREEY